MISIRIRYPYPYPVSVSGIRYRYRYPVPVFSTMPNVCVSVIFTYCQNGGEIDGVGFYYLETDGVEFDTYWQNGGYTKISDIIFAVAHLYSI